MCHSWVVFSCGLLLASCSTITTFGGSEDTEGQSDTESSAGILPTGSAEPSSSESTSAVSGSSSGGDSTGDDGNSFLNASTSSGSAPCGGPLPDGIVATSISSCSVLVQDCCPGDACRAWANDGGPNWNSTRCVSVDPDAASVGELCTVEGSEVTGLDSCDVGLMCWEVDPDTLEGTCIEYCTGTEERPACSSPDDVCGIYNDASLALCLPRCDPFLNDCAEDDACVPAGSDTFGCIAERYPRCPGGTTEINPRFGADCTYGELCCSPYCDVSDDAACDGGLECAALPESHSTYPGLGVCVSGI
ncbi:MAG: hypothetical protein KUG77_19060 [Nannocystaceae bacterium]|nr:hypothetical protein [Nannocystaceae bacterium]